MNDRLKLAYSFFLISLTLGGVFFSIWIQSTVFEGLEYFGKTYSRWDYFAKVFATPADRLLYASILLGAIVSFLCGLYQVVKQYSDPNETLSQRTLKEVLEPYDATLSTKTQAIISVLVMALVVPFLYYLITTFA